MQSFLSTTIFLVLCTETPNKLERSYLAALGQFAGFWFLSLAQGTLEQEAFKWHFAVASLTKKQKVKPQHCNLGAHHQKLRIEESVKRVHFTFRTSAP